MLELASALLLGCQEQQTDELNVANTKLKKLEEDSELERNSLKSELAENRVTIQNLKKNQKLQDELSSLEGQNQRLKSMSAEFKICVSKRISVALSCGHTLCDNCFGKVSRDQGKKCPFCNQKILGN